jgi:hypothetical protein
MAEFRGVVSGRRAEVLARGHQDLPFANGKAGSLRLRLMTWRKRNVLIAVFAIIFAVAGGIVWLASAVAEVPKEAYAVWWTADLVIEHMEKHDGTWPRSWDNLRSTAENAYKGTVSTNRDGTVIAEFRPRATIPELRQWVEVDWNADPKQLVKADFKQKGPPFRVIWLKNGRATHYSGREPNDMVLGYLKSKEK